MASRATPPRPSHARVRNGHLCGVLWTKRPRLLSTCNELEESHRVLIALQDDPPHHHPVCFKKVKPKREDVKCLPTEHEEPPPHGRWLKRRLKRQPRSPRNSLPRVRPSRMPRSLSLCELTGTFLITFKTPGRAGKTGSMKRCERQLESRSARRAMRGPDSLGKHLLILSFSGFDPIVGPRADMPNPEQLVAVRIPLAPFQDPDGCETMRCVVLTPWGRL